MQNCAKIRNYSLTRGATAVEMLLVVAVLGVIITMSLPQLSELRENQVLKASVNDILSSLNKAKSKTLASENSSSYGVHFESNQIVIFSGTSYSSGSADNESISIIYPAAISEIDIEGGGTNIYFNRLKGTPSAAGSLVVSTPNYSKTITISATGVASSN